MRPKTISASALNVAELCLARYKAENIDFTPHTEAKTAANIGTSVHGALEEFVRKVYMEKAIENTLEALISYYDQSFVKTFGALKKHSPEYIDGHELLEKWFKRTDLSSVEVISVEKKTRMPVPSSIGPVPMTYIWDRCDIFYEGDKKILRITDYKTIQRMLSPDNLRGLLQARIYDLAARTQFKDQGIDEYQVVFDLLRHDPVGVVFSYDEAVSTWEAVKAALERIIATPDDRAPETLNPECAYCVRKTTCGAIQRNIAGGGIFSIEDISEIAKLRMDMENQSRGLAAAISELDQRLLAHAESEGVLSFNTDDDLLTVDVTASRRRTVDARMAADILGPDIMARYGKLGVGDLDKLIASGDLSASQIKEVGRAISFTVSDEKIRVGPAKK